MDGVATGLSKVPAVTLGFWIIKIAATTLGETGGDTVTMTLNWGYLAGTALFFARCSSSWSPCRSRRRNFIRCSTGRPSSPPRPSARRWPISPTARSASATPAARRCCCSVCWASLGPLVLVGGHHLRRTRSTRRRSRHSTGRPSPFRKRLGTALGDWMADYRRLGYRGGALVFAAALAVVAALYYWSSRVAGACCSGPRSS